METSWPETPERDEELDELLKWFYEENPLKSRGPVQEKLVGFKSRSHKVVMHVRESGKVIFDVLRSYPAFPQWSAIARNINFWALMEGRQIGRNEQCPCGSSKKYKRCCL